MVKNVYVAVSWKGDVSVNVADLSMHTAHAANFIVVKEGDTLKIWKDRFLHERPKVITKAEADARAIQYVTFGKEDDPVAARRLAKDLCKPLRK